MTAGFSSEASPRGGESAGGFPLEILGRPVAVLQPQREETGGPGGGDLDVAVGRMDELWPLRAPSPWRVCQILHYDSTGWYFILEAEGRALPLDVVSDPTGIGRYGMPSGILAPASQADPEPGARAAYLCAKRTLKDADTSASWLTVFELASLDAERFSELCRELFGREADSLVPSVLRGSVPDARVRSRARHALRVRRFRTPGRAATLVALNVRRFVERVRWPTGLTIVVAGPDGVGKSTVANALAAQLSPFFRRGLRMHWRPGLLPRPGAVARRDIRDYLDPQADPPYGRVVSAGLLLYYWADFFLGAWLKIVPARLRTGLTLIERGWWDIAVDPGRYRLRVPLPLVRALGRLLPSPDVTVTLVGSPEVIAARKAEISVHETARQMDAWQSLPGRALRRMNTESAGGVDASVAEIRSTVLRLLETRTMRRLGSGWTSIGRSARWVLPRGPRAVAASSLKLYQPMTRKARLGWSATVALSEWGAFRALPRSPAPDARIRRLIGPFLEPGETLAVSRSNHPHRYIVALVSAANGLRATAKVALDEAGCSALRREGEALVAYAPLLPPGIAAPSVIARGDGVLVLGAVDWILRRRPWELPHPVAAALGQLHAAGVQHGDAAPWNLLQTADGWVLLDWESARQGDVPYFDLFHYLVQSFTLLGRPTENEILSAIRGQGPLAEVFASYEETAGLQASERRAWLPQYLRQTIPPSDGRADHVTGRRKRERLAARAEAIA